MIVVRTPLDELFNYQECREMFEQFHEKIEVDDFDTVLKSTQFFAFYDWNKAELIGCIYFYKYPNDEKLYITGFTTRRKNHMQNIECLIMALDFYTCDIYAECKEKTAQLCLKEVGFERIKKELYIYRRNK